MTAKRLSEIISKSPGLTMDGLMVMLKGMDDDSPDKTTANTDNTCSRCAYSANDLPIDREHEGCLACRRYMKYKKPDGFCDEFVSRTTTDGAEDEADTVKKPRKKNASE